MKECSKCIVEKELNDFTEGRNHCKECRKEYRKKHNKENLDVIKNQSKKRWIENKDREQQRNKEYRLNNIDNLRKKDRDNYKKNIVKQRDRIKKYRKENPDKVLETQKKSRKKRYQEYPILKLTHNVRTRLNGYLKINNITKKNKTFEIVGCSPQFLKDYLEKKFTEGMSWELMGQHIHIDHIVPLSSDNNEEEVYKLCHHTNLQPLWAEDNLRKSNKII